MSLFRGLADDLALADWLNNYIFPAEGKMVSPEFVRAGTRLAALEMIESGTTTFADMYYFEEEIAKETHAAGLRGVLGQTIIQFPVADAKTPADSLARAEAFIKEFQGNPLITPAVAPHALYTLDGPTLKAARDLSRRYNVPTLIHVAESRDEVKTAQERFKQSPVMYLDSLGFLGPGVVAAHGIWVSDADIAVLKARGVGVSHNPESNMKLASGVAPVTAYLRADVNIGLGTDGAASNNDLDMFVRVDEVRVVPPEGAHLRSTGAASENGHRDGHHPRRPRPRHGQADRIARARQARRRHHRRHEQRAPDADVRSAVAPRLRHPRRRRADDDRQRQGADAQSRGADARRGGGAEGIARLGAENPRRRHREVTGSTSRADVSKRR
jgi:hypothetical protein